MNNNEHQPSNTKHNKGDAMARRAVSITALITMVLSISLMAAPAQAATAIRTSAFAYNAVTGLLTKEIIEPDNSTLCLVTEYTLDAFGNKTTATTRNCNGSTDEAAAPTGDPVITPAAPVAPSTREANSRW